MCSQSDMNDGENADCIVGFDRMWHFFTVYGF